jgi:NAD(P)H-dependent flavin oxidoreductase YrpB (nitropropane dioxygenase family)
MNEQNPSHPPEAHDADAAPQRAGTALRISHRQILALLGRVSATTPRRAFLASALAAGTTAAAAASAPAALSSFPSSAALGALSDAKAAARRPPAEGEASRLRAAQRSLQGLHTRLTREYGVRLPFVGAGMGFIATPQLVAAVSNAGGIGVLGNAIEPPPSTQALIQQIKLLTPGLFGVDFIVDDSAFGPLTTDAHIDVCIAEQVRLVVFHMNVPPKEWVDRLHASGARVWMQAASTKQAVDAVSFGIDAVIAQGLEAGGHNKSTTRALTLLAEVIEAVHPVMVLAAGGIADGAGVFKALLGGAQGVWVGTRLVASTEAYAHAQYKARLVAAEQNSTVTTTMFGPEYPNRPYRVLRNRVVDQFAGRENTIPNPPPPPAIIGKTTLFPSTFRQPYEMPKFSAIVPTPDTVGDFEEMGLPAGDGVRLIKTVMPAARIVATMMNDARLLLEQALAKGVG